MKVAIIHDWLITYRGGERVLQALLKLFPYADIYTLFYLPKDPRIRNLVQKRNIYTSFFDRFYFIKNNWRKFLFLHPFAIKTLRLKEKYDFIISLHHCVSKSINTNGIYHYSYVFSPMRYLWLPELYFDNPLKIRLWEIISHPLKIWDKLSANNVNFFIAISEEVKKRIKRFYSYNRRIEVIYPPVNTDFFKPDAKVKKEDFYLFVGHLTEYKKATLVVKSFEKLKDKKLIVIGEGPLYKKLKKNIPENVQLLGSVSDRELRKYYQRAKCLIFPSFEDFGIVPLEAVSSGTPIIAFKKGGAYETLNEDICIFFEKQSEESLLEAIRKFEKKEFLSPQKMHEYVVNRFSEEKFLHNWKKLIYK